jgi:predicted DsbA family dithiol-disulfide isomerase
VLLRAAKQAGLDEAEAREVIESGRYADEVRAAERHWQELGIHSVPSVIIDDQHLIQGGQPPEVFERALRQLAGR